LGGNGQFQIANSLPSGSPGSVRSAGNGIAGVTNKDGNFILFR
jgi:hypothetical protein